MKNTIRCCISCILPCGALDVIRIVHANGKVEEISGSVKAAEIMKIYPKHVLKKPSSSYYSSEGGGVCPKIVVVPPDAELKRGKIYFLMPLPTPSSEKNRSKSSTTTTRKKKTRSSSSSSSSSSQGLRHNNGNSNNNNNNINGSSSSSNNMMVSNDQYLSEILSEKVSTQRDRRRGRVGIWRPHLESISEAANHEA
ncbi:putative uncharacterized protein DDB_G0283223 [Solanum pennellii]|uniref:Uncharacterized protein n=1 Tax=Solanum pennellii TaxID=28526 RepID=A0ABM1G2K2_SOLPN|nr:putative uncharacterized protein DDB_G0283223 [Solanum pennellii]